MMPTEHMRPDLIDVNASVRLASYVRDIWTRRSYVWYVSVNELRSRQVTTVLGNLWHLLNPALTIAVFYLIFGVLLETRRGVDNFILFLAVGLFIFQFAQRATTAGASSITANSGLIRVIKFPRALLPITSTFIELLNMIPTVLVLALVAVLTGEPITWRWIILPAVLALQFVFNLGAAMFAARMTTHFRDTTQLLPFFFRLLLYASGVIFNVSAYVESGSNARWLFVLNPIYCFIESARWCVMNRQIDNVLIVSEIAWSAAIVVFGFLWFRAGEREYARD